MASADSTSAEPILKEYYTDEQVRDLCYEDNVALSLFKKVTKGEGFVGKKYIQPVQFGRGQGRSADSAKAMANKSANRYVDFEVTMASDFATHAIERKVIKESANDRGSFFRVQIREFNDILKSLTRSAAIALYRNGSGAIGVVATGGISGNVITLAEPEDASNFELDQVLVSAAAETTGALNDAGATMTVTAIDEDLGKITVDSLVTGTTDAHFLFTEGDRNAKIKGLLSWIPVTAPTAGDSHFTVDRSVHVTRLAGYRLSATSVPIYEAVRRICAAIGKGGGSPDTAFCSHQKYRDLELSLENKILYITTNVTANIGFTGIKVVGTRSPVSIYADHNCPDARMPVLTLDTWRLASLGPVPDIFDNDGNRILREVAGWGFEMRADYFANLVCSAPRDNGMLTLE